MYFFIILLLINIYFLFQVTNGYNYLTISSEPGGLYCIKSVFSGNCFVYLFMITKSQLSTKILFQCMKFKNFSILNT